MPTVSYMIQPLKVPALHTSVKLQSAKVPYIQDQKLAIKIIKILTFCVLGSCLKMLSVNLF